MRGNDSVPALALGRVERGISSLEQRRGSNSGTAETPMDAVMLPRVRAWYWTLKAAKPFRDSSARPRA